MRDPAAAERLQAELTKAQWVRLPPMFGLRFRRNIEILGLTPADAAYLLGVSLRTVQRWIEDDAVQIPGPVDAAIRGWLMLNVCGVDWKPLKDGSDAKQ